MHSDPPSDCKAVYVTGVELDMMSNGPGDKQETKKKSNIRDNEPHGTELMESDIEEILDNIGSGEDKIVASHAEAEGKRMALPKGENPMPEEAKVVGHSRNPGKSMEEESFDKLVGKVDEVYKYLDELSKGIVQVNADLISKFDLIKKEMDRFANNLRDVSDILSQVKSNMQGVLPSMQEAPREEREPSYAAPPRPQQPPPPTSYPSQPYTSQPPSYAPQPPPQQQYYTNPQQSYQPSYYQQPSPPTSSTGMSPEEAVARGIESLRGSVFDGVISALDQFASIIFSRLLDAREKILRMDPSFPVQEFDPALGELRHSPRMKLSHVDKKKLIDKMLNWVTRIPRQP